MMIRRKAEVEDSGIACDRQRIADLFEGRLSDADEAILEQHLCVCEDCRQALHDVGSDSFVDKAHRFLSNDDQPQPSKIDLSVANSSDTLIDQILSRLAPSDDPEMLGRIGPYEVRGVIGAGGMGVVLKAIDRSLDRTVAIKVLAPHLANSGSARKRFAREAKATAAVLHPNVIAIYSVSDELTQPYLVMPYLRGPSLQKRIDRDGPMAVKEILRVGAQVAAGLAAAHAQGLVHRDIKPANVLLEDGVERVSLTDFGLARAVDDVSVTHSGIIAGTPQYMSPEQARAEKVDQRSDLFSLGSLLYAMCTGHPPFRAESSYSVMRLITDRDPRPIQETNPDIPDWLSLLISRLMSKQAEDRFESAEAVAELLEQCLAHVQQPTEVSLPESVVPKPSPRSSFFRSHKKGVLAMIAFALFGMMAVVFAQATNPPDIDGKWAGDGWGNVALKQQESGVYVGDYRDEERKVEGTLSLKWSRVERQYKGTWQEGTSARGRLTLRLDGKDIRGAVTTRSNSRNTDADTLPGRPTITDFHWQRSAGEIIAEPAASEPMQLQVKPGQLQFEIPVQPRRLSQADINRRFPFKVFGRVTDTEGNPIADAQVHANIGVGTLWGASGGRTTTDADGKYRLYFRGGMIGKSSESAAFGAGVQTAQFYVDKQGWELSTADAYQVYLITDMTKKSFEQKLNAEGGKFWGKTDTDEVVFANKPREINFVLRRGAAGAQSGNTPTAALPTYSGNDIRGWLFLYRRAVGLKEPAAIPECIKAIELLREHPASTPFILDELKTQFNQTRNELNPTILDEAAERIVKLAGRRNQKVAIEYLFKIADVRPMPQKEADVERMDEGKMPIPLEAAIRAIDRRDRALAEQIGDEMTTSSRRIAGALITMVSVGQGNADVDRWFRENAVVFHFAFSRGLDDPNPVARQYSQDIFEETRDYISKIQRVESSKRTNQDAMYWRGSQGSTNVSQDSAMINEFRNQIETNGSEKEHQRRLSKTPESLRPLAGKKWIQVSHSAGGKVAKPDSPGVLFYFTYDGLWQTHVPNGSDQDSGTTFLGEVFVRFSWRKSHAEFEVSTKDDWSDVQKGIAKLDGDKLTLCLGAKGAPRPTIFATGDTPGAGDVMWECVCDDSPPVEDIDADDGILGVHVDVLLSIDYSKEVMEKNVGIDGIGIIDRKSFKEPKSFNDLESGANAFGNCRMESFEKVTLEDRDFWRAKFFVPQGDTFYKQNLKVDQQFIDETQSSGAEYIMMPAPHLGMPLLTEPIWGDPVDGLQLGISGIRNQQRFDKGDLVTFGLLIRNVGTEDARFQYIVPELSHFIHPTIFTASGQRVRLHTVGFRGGVQTHKETLKPQESVSLRVTGAVVLGESKTSPRRHLAVMKDAQPGQYKLNAHFFFNRVDASGKRIEKDSRLKSPSVPFHICDESGGKSAEQSSTKLSNQEGQSQRKRNQALDEAVEVARDSVVSIQSLDENKVESVGTGIIVDPRGYIATKGSLVDGKRTISVTLASHESVSAEILAIDESTGLALIKVNVDQPLPVIRQESNFVKVGTKVAIIFCAKSEKRSAIGSVLATTVDAFDHSPHYSLHFGADSTTLNGVLGAPLVNWRGEIVGIVDGQVGGPSVTAISSNCIHSLKDLIRDFEKTDDKSRVDGVWMRTLPDGSQSWVWIDKDGTWKSEDRSTTKKNTMRGGTWTLNGAKFNLIAASNETKADEAERTTEYELYWVDDEKLVIGTTEQSEVNILWRQSGDAPLAPDQLSHPDIPLRRQALTKVEKKRFLDSGILHRIYEHSPQGFKFRYAMPSKKERETRYNKQLVCSVQFVDHVADVWPTSAIKHDTVFLSLHNSHPDSDFSEPLKNPRALNDARSNADNTRSQRSVSEPTTVWRLTLQEALRIASQNSKGDEGRTRAADTIKRIFEPPSVSTGTKVPPKDIQEKLRVALGLPKGDGRVIVPVVPHSIALQREYSKRTDRDVELIDTTGSELSPTVHVVSMRAQIQRRLKNTVEFTVSKPFIGELKPQTILNVRRGEKRIGQVQVVRVRDNLAIARITDEPPDTPIIAGDSCVYSIASHDKSTLPKKLDGDSGKDDAAKTAPLLIQKVIESMASHSDKSAAYWSKRSLRGWRAGVRIVQSPTLDNPNLIIQPMLRNVSDLEQAVNLSISGRGKQLYEVTLDAHLHADISGGSRIEDHVAKSTEILQPQRWQVTFDFTGLDAGRCSLKLASPFSIPAEDQTGRTGIPLGVTIPLQIPGVPAADTDYSLLPISWGKPVSGLRVGIMFRGATNGTATLFRHGDLAEAELFVQNVTQKTLSSGFIAPHFADGWWMNIDDADGRPIQPNLVRSTIISTPPQFRAELVPGEIQPITGNLPRFREVPGEDSEMDHAQFQIAAANPKTPEHRPPYTYALPVGSYTASCYLNLRRTDMPNARISVTTGKASFRVLAADHEAKAKIKDGPISRYTVSAWTTGHGKPPKVGGRADVFINIHEPDPTSPEVRPLVRGARVTNTHDPNPDTTRNRVVDIELELSKTEIQRIKQHEPPRTSFTFRPVKFFSKDEIQWMPTASGQWQNVAKEMKELKDAKE